MPRVAFIDPATGTTYEWHRGYEAEEDSGKTRQISGQANTGQTGRVRQQGDDGPYVRTVTGKIVHAAQRQQFWEWYELCKTQTIHLRDHDGAVYEGQIVALNMHPVRRLPNLAPDQNLRHVYYEYSLAFDVYDFVSGAMAEAGLTP